MYQKDKQVLGCAGGQSTTASRQIMLALMEGPAGISRRLCMGARVSGSECACTPQHKALPESRAIRHLT